MTKSTPLRNNQEVRQSLQISKNTPIYDSEMRRKPELNEIRELARYWHLVIQLTRRDIVTRYKRSFLGIAWTMLNPLGTTVILAFVFSQVFGSRGPYAVYVLSGLLPWTFFSQATSACMVGLIAGGSLIRKIYLPRTVFSISAILTALINLALSLFPLLIVMLLYGLMPKPSLLFLPFPTLCLAMFTLGIGLILSSIAIYFPDVREMYQIILTAWLYLSPVIYTEDFLPPKYVWIIHLNPMYYLINLFRAPIYDGVVPPIPDILLSFAIGFVTLLTGWVVFTRKAEEFAYRV